MHAEFDHRHVLAACILNRQAIECGEREHLPAHTFTIPYIYYLARKRMHSSCTCTTSYWRRDLDMIFDKTGPYK